MERSKSQYIPRKPRWKKLETEGNQIKPEQTKLYHQSQQDTEQYQQLCKTTDDLQEGLSAEQIIHEKQKKLRDLENEVDGLKVTVGKKEHAIKSLREENDDFLTRQWQKKTEENAKQRCTIERYKEQIADMSKQLGLHQQEKTYILTMANSMVTLITEISARKKIINSCTLNRPEGMSVDSFIDNMELILNRFNDMKNEMITTEQNLAANISHVAKGTDEQRITEERLNREIEDQAKTIHAQDKELKKKLSRIQEINSAYEGMKYENDKLRPQIVDNQKTANQQQLNQSHNLVVENDELRRRLSIADDTGNQNIATLCDPNRPMKLAEKFGDLYDNEWTDAIDCVIKVKALYPDMKTAAIEEVIMRHLYQLVMCCYHECVALSKDQMEDVGNTIVNALNLNTKEHDRDIPGCMEVSTFRRQAAAKYADYLFKHKVIVDNIVLSDWEYVRKSKELVGILTETPFFEKCVHLCWHMAIQDPVMHLDEELTPDTTYDKSVYREFMKSGNKVTFVVWPALFFHEDGPLLNKGVVQAYC